jgi:hypothetical protein
MTWVKIDDSAPCHPKLLRAGPEAAWLWLAGLAYANRQTTDGVIPADALPALYPVEGWTRPKLLRLAEKLVDVGLWHPADAGAWAIHDYAHYQREAMRDEVERRREVEREKKRRQRGSPHGDNAPVPTGRTGGHSRSPAGTGTGVPAGVPVGTNPMSRHPGPARPIYTPTPSSGSPGGQDAAEAQRARFAALASKGDA